VLAAAQASPSDPDTFPFVVLGNKVDVEGGKARQVSEKKAKQWCGAKGGIPHFDTSAKVRRAPPLGPGGGAMGPTGRVSCCTLGISTLASLFTAVREPLASTLVVRATLALAPPQEDLNVDDAFATIARNALKNESEEELYIPETVDMNAQAQPRRAQSSCC
jgi:GTPase SAR1 family protein